jgi:hypothetical protein
MADALSQGGYSVGDTYRCHPSVKSDVLAAEQQVDADADKQA